MDVIVECPHFLSFSGDNTIYRHNNEKYVGKGGDN